MTPWAVALQAPLSVRFLRQEYWSGYSTIPRVEKWIRVTGMDSCRTGDLFGKQENSVSEAERELGGFQVKSQGHKCRRLGKILLG